MFEWRVYSIALNKLKPADHKIRLFHVVLPQLAIQSGLSDAETLLEALPRMGRAFFRTKTKQAIKIQIALISHSRNSDAADKILKPWIASQRVKSGIHPDPRHSSRSLKEPLLQ